MLKPLRQISSQNPSIDTISEVARYDWISLQPSFTGTSLSIWEFKITTYYYFLTHLWRDWFHFPIYPSNLNHPLVKPLHLSRPKSRVLSFKVGIHKIAIWKCPGLFVLQVVKLYQLSQQLILWRCLESATIGAN